MLMGMRSSGGEGSLGIAGFQIFRYHPPVVDKRHVTKGRRRNRGTQIRCESSMVGVRYERAVQRFTPCIPASLVRVRVA